MKISQISFAVTALTGALLLAAAQSPSSAQQPADVELPPGVTAAQVHNQQLVDEVVEQMWRSSDPSGYARSSVDIDALTVEIMWKGEPPADVRQLEGITKEGVRVTIVKVPFNAQEMIAAGTRVLQASIKAETSAQANAAYANEAFDGLVVEVGAEDFAAASRATSTSQFASHAQVPVSLRQGEPAVELSRWNDSNGSWHGGAGMTRGPLADPWGTCSTGFAVLVPSGPRAGEGRLLSAGHCDVNWAGTAFLDTAWNDGNGDRLTEGGPDVWVDRAQTRGTDSLVMDPVGGTVGRMLGGPWDATSSHSRFVVSVGSAYHNSTNDIVWTGGANSGEHCCGRITNLNVVVGCLFGGRTCVFHRMEWSGSVEATLAVPGDSGGPVYATRSDGRVSARGIINQGLNLAPCPPTRYPVAPRCYSQVYFSPIRPILDRWDKTIETHS